MTARNCAAGTPMPASAFPTSRCWRCSAEAGFAADPPVALPGRPLTVKIWTGRKHSGTGGADGIADRPPIRPPADERHPSRHRCSPRCRGDIAVSFEFFPPKTEKMEEQLWNAMVELAPLAPASSR